jgi:hypothetical protein
VRILFRIAARAPTYIADARADPGWLAMFALARLLPVRQALWKLSSSTVTAQQGSPQSRNSLIGTAATDRLLAELRMQGLGRGISLPQTLCSEILQFGNATPCFGNLDRGMEFLPADHYTVQRRRRQSILTGHYFDRSEECPAIYTIRDDEALHHIATAYLGTRARVTSTRLWWSFPTEAVSEASMSPPRTGCTSIWTTGAP